MSKTQRTALMGVMACAIWALVSCANIPGDPYIRPYIPDDGQSIGVEIGWRWEFRTPAQSALDEGTCKLLLTTRVESGSRIYVLTCDGGPGDELEWVASTAAEAKALLEDIADDTGMILPEDPGDREELFDDVEDWIDNEWMSPDAFHASTGL